MACVDLPAFPLQLLVRKHPEWRDHPSAVVTHDTPQGEILQVNRAARRSGILPGQRYAPALSLCPDLRGGVVPNQDIQEGVDLVTRLLDTFTPSVEPSINPAGVFHLDASGLDRIHGSPQTWAKAVKQRLEEAGLVATVVVGFTRFGTYAMAREGGGGEAIVLPNQERETAAARKTHLERLGLEPTTRNDLARLGIKTVGQLLALPKNDLKERFGQRAHRLFQEARGELWQPLTPKMMVEPPSRFAELDFPDTDSTRLLFLIKRLLSPLLGEVVDRGEALTELTILLALDHADDVLTSVKTAAPTLDQGQILDLTRLKLESLDLAAGVVEMTLFARTVEATHEQLRLFCESSRRDPAAAGRVFARLRAQFGNNVVVRAKISDGHLPEAQFSWEPLYALPTPTPQADDNDPGPPRRCLIRRIYSRPIPMNTRPVHGPGGVHLRGLDHEPVIKILGPYVISGGWWNREVHREYHFAETSSGQIMWVYFDRQRRRWFLQGLVE